MGFFIPYIYDYQLNANIDLGTFTAIGITATAYTEGEEDEAFDWKNVSGSNAEQKILDIGRQITELMEAKEEFLGEKLVDENGEEIEWAGSNGGGLAEKYSAMLENADDSWIEIFRAEIFDISGSVDPLHILVYGVSADFVVSANMYVTLGLTFEYGNAKRYNFSLMLFHKQSTSETIDLEESHYQFDFYVMGTMGIRAGIELEIGVGLFSLELDSVGITAEAGVYAQLWGYFYYSLRWSKSEGKNSSYSGAIFVEIGSYLEIKFKAQLFSSSKLTYNPTLYEKSWPLWSAGEAENVYDFAYGKKDTPEFVWYADKTLTLPDSLFTMQYIDLTSGEQDEKTYDDTEFIITFSNPVFSYDTETNTLTVSPETGSIEETGEMTITWRGAPLAMTSRPVSRIIKLNWADPESGRYIKFETNGGSMVNMIFKGEGAPVSPPVPPTKKGYVFAGWYENRSFTKSYDFPATMPATNTTVYAKWNPATDTRYTVRHHQQNLNDNGYTMVNTDTMQGTTESYTAAAAKEYYGFDPKPIQQQIILPDGSAVVNVYYDREEYTISFTYGALRDVDNPDTYPVTYTRKYGSTIYAPKLALGGYIFNGFTGWPTVTEDGKQVPADSIMLTQDITYASEWTADPNTPYRVEHYIQRISGSGYLLDSVEQRSGETDTAVILADLASASSGLTYTGGTVGGKSVSETKIKGDGNLVIKLYYDRNLFDITYKIGTETYTTDKVRFGASITAPVSPVWEGYVFEGWYEDEELTKPFTFGNPMPGKNLTIYGNKMPGEKTYTIQHYLMNTQGVYELYSTDNTGKGKTNDVITLSELIDGDITVENGIVYKEGKVGGAAKTEHTLPATGSVTFALYYDRLSKTYTFKPANGGDDIVVTRLYGAAVNPPAVTRTGYTFNGWSPDVPAAAGTDDATFTAQWLANTDTLYKVEHYLQNADNDEYELDATDNLGGTTDTTVDAVPKSYEHYTLNANAEGTVSSGTVLPDGTLVLKLYYDRETYTITFDANEGVLGGESSKTLRHGAAVTTANPEREGYAFDGWYLESGTINPFNGVMPANSLTVYAKWVAGQVNYKVEHYVMQTDGSYPGAANKTDNNKGTADSVLTLADLQDGTLLVTNGIVYKNGEVNGQTVTGTTISADGKLLIKLYYERKQHNLSWDLNGGTASNSYTQGLVYFDADITGPDAEKTGHSLSWNPVFTGKMPAADTTYRAVWTPNNYTISFVSNGGSAVAPIEQAFGTMVTPPANPTRTGYTFVGWLKDGNPYTFGSMPAEDITLTASWQANKYSFELVPNGGVLSGYGTIEHTYDQQTVLPTASEITKPGHIFMGWYFEENFSGTARTAIAGTDEWEGTRRYYAKWEPEKYTITFVYNNGNPNYVLNNVDYGTAFSSIRPSDPTRAGYRFTGWNPEAETVTGAQTFTAQWEIVTYAITYANIPENGINENPDTYTILDTITLREPRAPAKSFTGWTYGTVTVPATEVVIGSGTTGDLTFTANWSDVDSYTIRYVVDGAYWTGSGPDTYSYSTTNKVALPTPPEKPGYIFAGWREKDAGTVKNIYKIPKGDFGNKVYEAQWTLANAGDVWVISDEDGLARFRDLVNGGSTSLHAKLSNDIVLETYKNWTPIGFNASATKISDATVANNSYTGTFDGQGHTISGLDAKWTVAYDEMRLGFFQYVNGGTVKDFVLEGSMDMQPAHNVANFTAGIVGELISGSISGCTSRISLSGSGRATFGGIAGRISGGTIDNCTNESNITWTGTGNIAGIVCTMYGGLVSNCTNNGNLEDTYSNGVVGGIAATVYASVTISNCVNNGNLKLPLVGSSFGSNLGGIVGYVSKRSIIEGCRVSGSVILDGNVNVCGIVGGLSGSDTDGGLYSTVKDCIVEDGLTLIGCWDDYSNEKCGVRPICRSTYENTFGETYVNKKGTFENNTYGSFTVIIISYNTITQKYDIETRSEIPGGVFPPGQGEGGMQGASSEGMLEMLYTSDEDKSAAQDASVEGEAGMQDTPDKGGDETQNASGDGVNEMPYTPDKIEGKIQDFPGEGKDDGEMHDTSD